MQDFGLRFLKTKALKIFYLILEMLLGTLRVC